MLQHGIVVVKSQEEAMDRAFPWIKRIHTMKIYNEVKQFCLPFLVQVFAESSVGEKVNGVGTAVKGFGLGDGAPDLAFEDLLGGQLHSQVFGLVSLPVFPFLVLASFLPFASFLPPASFLPLGCNRKLTITTLDTACKQRELKL